MMETNCGLLLLLLLLAVTQRNSSADVIASPDGMMDGALPSFSGPTVNGTTEGAPANMSSPTANDMIEGVELLTKTFTWLEDNRLRFNFNETIGNLEKDITNLPSELAVNRRQILEVLYRSQDRLTMARSVLEQAAIQLKSYCENIIDIIDTNDVSKKLLEYIAKQVVKYLSFVNGILKDASNILLQINDEFSDLKALLKDFNAALNSRTEEINEMKENEKEMIRIIKCDLELLKQHEMADKLNDHKECLERLALGLCVGILGGLCPLSVTHIATPAEKDTHILNLTEKSETVAKWQSLKIKFDLQNKLRSNIERKNKLQSKIEEAQDSTSALLSQVVVINEYIETGSDMITKRQSSLKTSILDLKDISIELIESKLKALKDRVVVLKNACTSFLNHESP